MNIVVHLGEPFWRSVGTREVAVRLAESATAAEALAALAQLHPALVAELNNGEVPPALFADDVQIWPDTRLAEGTHMHVVWPVSGG